MATPAVHEAPSKGRAFWTAFLCSALTVPVLVYVLGAVGPFESGAAVFAIAVAVAIGVAWVAYTWGGTWAAAGAVAAWVVAVVVVFAAVVWVLSTKGLFT